MRDGRATTRGIRRALAALAGALLLLPAAAEARLWAAHDGS